MTTHVKAPRVVLLADRAGVQADLRAEFNENRHDVVRHLGRQDALLHYCLLKSLRLQPVRACSFPQSPPQDKVLDGYRIPNDMSGLLSFLYSICAIRVRDQKKKEGQGEIGTKKKKCDDYFKPDNSS